MKAKKYGLTIGVSMIIIAVLAVQVPYIVKYLKQRSAQVTSVGNRK